MEKDRIVTQNGKEILKLLSNYMYMNIIFDVYFLQIRKLIMVLPVRKLVGLFLTPSESFETHLNLLWGIYELSHGCYGDLKAHPNFSVVISEIMSLGRFKL